MTYSPTSEPSAGPPLTGLLAVIARNTIIVLTAAPEQKLDWLASVQALLDAAKSLGETEMAALLDAIRRVLEGEPPEKVEPNVTGDYRWAWKRITRSLAGPQAPRLDMFDVLARNTLTALHAPEEKRTECARHFEALRVVAEDLDDAPLAALLGAITALLAGQPPAEITQELDGAYLACWETIVAQAG